jgi:hypothetical protein
LKLIGQETYFVVLRGFFFPAVFFTAGLPGRPGFDVFGAAFLPAFFAADFARNPSVGFGAIGSNLLVR